MEILSFAVHIPSSPTDVLAQGVIATKNAAYIYYFAREIKGAPIEELAKGMIATNNAEYIYHFARDVKEAPIEELAQSIIATKNAAYIYYFARDIKEAPIKELSEGIITTKNAAYIYYFARDIKGAPIKELSDAIIETNYAQYIYAFAQDITGAPKEKLAINAIYAKYKELINNQKLYNYNQNQEKELANYSESYFFNTIEMVKEFKSDINFLQRAEKVLNAKDLQEFFDILTTNYSVEMMIEQKQFYENIDIDYLNKLYQEGNYEEIRKNKERFAKLFIDNEDMPRIRIK